jgi:hypothetical protein
MGGHVTYGFRREPFEIDGIKTKRFIEEPSEADNVRLLFEMYSRPEVSLGDVARRLTELGIKIRDGDLQRTTLSKMLRNPVYVQADMDVYDFFKSQGADIINDAADFTGMNACYLYKGRDEPQRKMDTIAGQRLVLAPHMGIIPSDVWLKCRCKATNNKSFQPGRKVSRSWLAGKVKCGRCGYALMASTDYLRCRYRIESKECEGAGTLKVANVENFVYTEMVARLREFQTLTTHGKTAGNPKMTALKVELAKVEAEIQKLLDSLLGANDILISYANTKIAELDAKKQVLSKDIAELAIAEVSPEHMLRISELLDNWETSRIEDKREVTDALISRINATSDNIDIEWKI